MSTTDVSSITGAVSTPANTSVLDTSTLGKEDFLQLLTAQLTHQDPMNPMQDDAFVAQLAQFSSLEQMQNVNANLNTNILLQQSVNNSLATTLIGRDVVADGNSVHYTPGASTNLDFNLSGDANVTVQVKDSSGKTVATLKPGDLKSGKNSVSWDGKTDDGSTLTDGDYTFSVSATDSSGNAVSAETLVQGRVTGVRFDNGSTYLEVGSREFLLSDIQQILQASTTGT